MTYNKQVADLLFSMMPNSVNKVLVFYTILNKDFENRILPSIKIDNHVDSEYMISILQDFVDRIMSERSERKLNPNGNYTYADMNLRSFRYCINKIKEKELL